MGLSMSKALEKEVFSASISRTSRFKTQLSGLKNLAACEALPHGRTYGECARYFGSANAKWVQYHSPINASSVFIPMWQVDTGFHWHWALIFNTFLNDRNGTV